MVLATEKRLFRVKVIRQFEGDSSRGFDINEP